MTKGGLQIRMTFYVIIAVLLVFFASLPPISGRIQKEYENVLDERLSDDLLAISRIMEQRLLRIESSTLTMAALASQVSDNDSLVDSALTLGLRLSDNVISVAVVFESNPALSSGGYPERIAYYDDNGNVVLGSSVNGNDFESDIDWVKCYENDQSGWSEFSTENSNGKMVSCFCVPFYGRDGSRIGMAYSAVYEDYLTSFVTEYKLRKDVDISIYKQGGVMVVSPDDYIFALPPEQLIVRERVIEHIGWRIVLSADREIITRRVGIVLLWLLLFFILMFIVISLSIRFVVHFVAKPFIEDQRRVENEKSIMENEMLLASKAQRELVPSIFPPFPDRKELDVSACLHPARMVGGDLYDYFIEADKLYFCIGDVSGKGVQGSLFMSATHYLFRSTVAALPICDAARQMNLSLCTDNVHCRFVTFWMGCLDLVCGRLEYVNAGHDAPFLIRNGKVDSLPSSDNMPFAVSEDEKFVAGSLTLGAGDTLFLYTDGITEAMDAGGREFGRDRLHDAISETKGTNAASIVEGVLESVRRHSEGAGQSDDITMLCIKFISDEPKTL